MHGFLGILAVIIIGFLGWKPAMAQPPVVVEFFTSSRCQDSPPAQASFEHIFKDPDYAHVIALACHVTYFDEVVPTDTCQFSHAGQLIPTDPFATAACDEREVGYRYEELELGGSVPAMALSGRFQITGENVDTLKAGIAMLQKHYPLQDIISLNAEEYAPAANLELRETALENGATIYVVSYETLGNKLGLVRDVEKFMDWTGDPLFLSLPLPENANQNIAVLVHEGRQGPIIAAAKLERSAPRAD